MPREPLVSVTVSLDKMDVNIMSGYMNEIALLKRLEGNSRIIRLIGSEIDKAGPGGSGHHNKCAEIDLASCFRIR